MLKIDPIIQLQLRNAHPMPWMLQHSVAQYFKGVLFYVSLPPKFQVALWVQLTHIPNQAIRISLQRCSRSAFYRVYQYVNYFCRHLARATSERWNISMHTWHRWSWSWSCTWTDGIRRLLYTHIEWNGAFKTRFCRSDVLLSFLLSDMSFWLILSNRQIQRLLTTRRESIFSRKSEIQIP